MDILSVKERSNRMSKIRATDTRPELVVRRLLFSLGYRYRIHDRKLPGTPDIVFRSKKKVIFVHGCLWHSHDCRAGCRRPKSNTEYWDAKLDSNRVRDESNADSLSRLGWRTLTVWECDVASREGIEKTQARIIGFLED